MSLSTYRITLLIGYEDGSEEIRVVRQEGRTANEAIDTAKDRVQAEDFGIETVECQKVS